jgi:hypothetical protein
MTGRVIFKETGMNSMVVTRLRNRLLRSFHVREINYALSLGDLAFRFNLAAVPEITLWREERPHARYLNDEVNYGLFQSRGRQSLSAVLAELKTNFWFPVDTRVLMHFAKRFPPEHVPHKVLAPGSIHQPHSSAVKEFRFPYIECKDGMWSVDGVQLEGDDDVSDYVILAVQ